MNIKVVLTDEEVNRLGFKYAMNLKWKLEDQLIYLAHSDVDAEELMNEIQKNKK